MFYIILGQFFLHVSKRNVFCTVCVKMGSWWQFVDVVANAEHSFNHFEQSSIICAYGHWPYIYGSIATESFISNEGLMAFLSICPIVLRLKASTKDTSSYENSVIDSHFSRNNFHFCDFTQLCNRQYWKIWSKLRWFDW